MKKTIQYSSSANEPLTEYIGIGGCEVDPQDPEASLLPKDQTIEGWKEFLNVSKDIAPIAALNYILLMDAPEDYFPKTLLENYLKHKPEIEQIIHNWFEPDSSLFKFLDLINCDFASEVEELIELNDQETKYIFKDGSTLIINEYEMDKGQYFVHRNYIDKLNEDIQNIKSLLMGSYFQ